MLHTVTYCYKQFVACSHGGPEEGSLSGGYSEGHGLVLSNDI
jgi:hypothetical protein